MTQDDRTENGVQEEQFLCQSCFDLLAMLVQDVSSPHAQDFPSAELVEETFATDFLVVIPLNEPISQGDIVNRLIVLICGDTLA